MFPRTQLSEVSLQSGTGVKECEDSASASLGTEPGGVGKNLGDPRLALHTIIVMHLALLVDVVTVAAAIAIILAIADNGADHAAQYAAHGGPRTCPETGYDRTRDGAGSGTDHRSGGATGNHMISVGVAGTTSQGKAARGSGGD